MNEMIKTFKQKLEKEDIKGITKWSYEYDWEDRKEFWKYLDTYDEEKRKTLSQVQNTMILLARYSSQSVLDIKAIDIDISVLSDIEIDEVLSFYDLKKPEKRYREIRADIAGPESFLTRIPYKIIKALYEKGLVPFDRQIFVACLVRFNVWHAGNFTGALPPEVAEKVDKSFPTDDFTLDILMAVFEMELGVNGAFYMERDMNIGGVILHLVNNGTLKRDKIQQKIFEAFNNPTLKQSTLSWVKNLYIKLEFSKEENLACQSQLIELLHNDVDLVSNFGLKILKQISTQKTFDWEFFIDSLSGIVFRKKFNGGLKLAIKMLYKKLQKDTALLEKTCINLSPVFIQEEASVQEEAVKIFALLKEKNEAVSQALEPFVGTMHSDSKSALSFLLSEEGINLEIPYEKYVQQKYTHQPVSELQKLEYINSEEDFIFLCTKVLKSPDALDFELFLEALVRFYHIKDTHKKALGSALKMARKIVGNIFYIDVTLRQGIHHIFLAKLICIWLDDNELTIDDELKNWGRNKENRESYNNYFDVRLWAFNQLFSRLGFIAENIRANKKIELLSTPTHSNGAIDINLFFERLYEYEQNEIPINESDFCIALNRLNRWSKYKKPTEHKSEYRDILTYILDDKAKFDHKKIKQLENIWFSAFVIKNQSKSAKAIDHFLTKKAKWWTAKAENIYRFNRKYSSGGYSWQKIEFILDYKGDDETFVEVNQFSYYLVNYLFIIADASHWFLRNTYCLEPLYLSLILKNYNYLSDMEANETKSTIAALLESIKNPMPLGLNGMMFLCLSLFAGNTTVRNTALEWLMLLIDRGLLDLNLFTKLVSQMIGSEHHPFPIKRVSEQFEQLNQMGGVYVDVLHQTLNAVLPEMNPDNLPKSFKNILHFYHETLKTTKSEIPPKIKARLEAMQKKNAVKKEVKKILEL